MGLFVLDVIGFTKELISHWSVTPDDDGCMEIISKHLTELGFKCHRFDDHGVSNLYARIGDKSPNFCFLGHTDVVPPGDFSKWSVNPFAGIVKNGFLYGRGVSDMKGAIAAFIGAVERYLDGHSYHPSISLLLTSGKEGVADFGTKVMVEWLKSRNESLDACLVGQPTNPHRIGEMIMIGRRGILHGKLIFTGKSGDVSYPQFAQNPINLLVDVCDILKNIHLDEGFPEFQPSHLEITKIDVDNSSPDIIPGKAVAHFNVRFNPNYCGDTLINHLETLIKKSINKCPVTWKLECKVAGEAFLTENALLKNVTKEAVQKITGLTPELSTTGGTSDARFIKDLCPVIEFGLISEQAHQIDEHVRLCDIELLTDAYTEILTSYFKAHQAA